MKSFFKLLVCNCLILLLFGCVKSYGESINEAREAILAGTAECVLVNDNKIIATYSGGGVSPLLEIYKQNPQEMKDGTIIDKVIGRAAAFIVINGKAKGVYALLISEDAKELLEKYNIKVQYDKIVPKILNSQLTGLCPLEESVLGENDPSVALKKLQERIDSFQKNKSISSNKQDLGRLNFKATKFGLGGQAAIQRPPKGFDPVDIIIKAYNLGVNYFDTSNAYNDSQLYFGKAFKKLGLVPGLENYNEKNRHAVFLVSKTGLRWATPNVKAQGVRSFSNNSNASGCVDDIKRTLTQVFGDGKGNYPADAYIDMVLLHAIGTIEEVNAVYEGLEEIQKGIKPKRVGALAALKDFRDGTNLTGFNPKKEKVIKHIGVSGHGSPAVLMELIQRDKLNLLEGLLVSINPNDNLYFSMQNNLIPVAKAKNMGVIGMKVFANGALFSRAAQWRFSADDLVTTVGTPELASRLLIEYALTTPGVDIIITGIGKISDNQEECQLYQNLLAANNAPKSLSNKEREQIEALTKTVKGGKTNYFQAAAVKLTKPRNIQLKKVNRDNIISWDNAYAGESKISHYNIICNGKNIAQINYKPQTTLEQYSYIDKPTEEPVEYQISVTDQKGETVISDTIH